jgi:hypothetical protein
MFFPVSITRLQNLNLKNLQVLDYLDVSISEEKKINHAILSSGRIKPKVTTPIEANFYFNLDLAHKLC